MKDVSTFLWTHFGTPFYYVKISNVTRTAFSTIMYWRLVYLSLWEIGKFSKIFESLPKSYTVKQHYSSLLLLKCAKSVQTRSLFWFVFSRIWIGYGDLLRKFLYSFQIQENKDQKKLHYLGTFYSVQIRKNMDQKKKRIWTLFVQCNVWT